MLTGHLFAGAGGGLYADLILGHRPVFAVEWERYPAKVLQQRADEGWFPGLRVYNEDIRLFNPSEYAGRVDSLHAGFPCQDISVAGTGTGISGERSGLWSEVVRVARIIRPRELFLENSPAITSRGLGTVLGDLAELGFDAEWISLSAGEVGAPHRRNRWWCLARCADTSCVRCNENGSREPVAHGEELADANQERRHRRAGVQRQGWRAESKDDREAMADTLRPRRKERDTAAIASGEGFYPGCLDTQRRKTWWSVEPSVGRVVNGLANRGNRIKALGNGQVPLQAAMAYTILDARYAA